MKYFNETYRKREFLTRNEWADTYRATHAITEEHITLKVLVKKSSDENYINNLLQEVDKFKNIKNSNLININNMLKYDGCGKTYYYIEGEYFKGISLKEKFNNQKLENKEAIKVLETIALGLKSLHDNNISFDNLDLNKIVINSKGIIKLNCFDYLEEKEFLVENNNENNTKFNPKKDLESLGIILYSLLIKNKLFNKETFKREIKDKNICKIIERLTNDEQEDKYNNINNLILDLQSYLKYGVVKDNNFFVEKPKDKKEKKTKKVKFSKILAVCTVVALVTGAGVYANDYLKNNKNIDILSIIKNKIKSEEKVDKTKVEKEDNNKEINKKQEDKSESSPDTNKPSDSTVDKRPESK